MDNNPLAGTDPSGQCGGIFNDLCSVVEVREKVVHKVEKVTEKVVQTVAPVVAIAAVAVATIPHDETGTGEAIDVATATTVEGGSDATEAASADAAVGSAGDGATTRYCAVERNELPDIHAIGMYQVPEGIGDGKYFYPTVEQASNFAEMNPGQSYILTSGQFSSEVLKESWRETIAGEGQAYFIPSEHFPSRPVGFGGPLP